MRLRELWLGCNKIEKLVPIHLPQLIIISLSNNKLTSLIGIEQCINLEQCLADNNSLTCIEIMKELSNLKIIDISRNQITEISALYNHKLTDLWMSDNPLEAIKELLRLKHKDCLDSISFERCNCPSQSTCAQILRPIFKNLKVMNGGQIN